MRVTTRSRMLGRSAVAGCSHAFQVVDRLVVMRRGRIAAYLSAAGTNLEEVERIITG
jgi:ABC-type sugar transport system ATPase subunit